MKLPRIVFGTSCLGNLYAAIPFETKLDILREILRWSPSPAVLDCAGKYGAGLALEVIGQGLRALGAPPSAISISNKLGWLRTALTGSEPTFEPGVWVGLEHDAVQRISYEGILRCWEQGQSLLARPYQARSVSVHDPDEYLKQAGASRGRRATADVVDAYRALGELKAKGEVESIGIGAKDWRVLRDLADRVELDWVMLACSLTVYSHPPEVLSLVEDLGRRGVAVINSAVFHAGFLVGGEFFDYRRVRPEDPVDAPLFAYRERFRTLCRRHSVSSAAACVQFALSPPQISSVALNTPRPEQIRQNVELVSLEAPSAFWIDMKDQGLVARGYPYLG